MWRDGRKGQKPSPLDSEQQYRDFEPGAQVRDMGRTLMNCTSGPFPSEDPGGGGGSVMKILRLRAQCGISECIPKPSRVGLP